MNELAAKAILNVISSNDVTLSAELKEEKLVELLDRYGLLEEPCPPEDLFK